MKPGKRTYTKRPMSILMEASLFKIEGTLCIPKLLLRQPLLIDTVSDEVPVLGATRPMIVVESFFLMMGN